MLTHTPLAITAAILRLATTVVRDAQPVFVKVIPRRGGEINECFKTVAAHVEEHDGLVQHGWALWEWPRVMVEAEFHAVWRSPAGSLIDVTPRGDSVERILFVSDPERRFTGRAIDNVRQPLTGDSRVMEFMRLAEQKYEILNRGDRAHQFGAVAVPKDEIAPVILRMMDLQSQLAEGPRRNDPCPCGSGWKYKRCHGA